MLPYLKHSLVIGWTALIGLTAPETAAGSDWPQWRGPQRNALSPETGLLRQWPEEGPRLLWKTGGLGQGYSSVSIADGRIFTMGDRDDQQWVIALDQKTREELWAAKVGPGRRDGPRCTPTVDGSRVYALGTHGDLVCVQAESGEVLWRKNYGDDFGGRMMSGWGYSESPLVDGNKLICVPGGSDAAVIALNKRTGKKIWQCPLPDIGSKGKDGAGYSGVVVSHGGGVRQFIALLGRGVIGVAAEDGRFLWGYNKVANDTANIPTPLVHEDYVFCSTGYGAGAALLHLEPDGDGVNAREVYFLPGQEFQNHHGGMVMLGDYIYAGHGHNNGLPICIEWRTGEVQWGPTRGPGSGSAAVVYADDRLYFRYQNAVMALIDATPEEYRASGSFELATHHAESWPHPVIHNGRLYLRDQQDLLCYDIRRP